MPLVHSKKPAAFKKNIEAEIHAGKPQNQAVAIAYSVKRKAEHKSMGGEVSSDGCEACYAKGGLCEAHMDEGGPVLDPDESKKVQDGFTKALGPGGTPQSYAEGGAVGEPEDEMAGTMGAELLDGLARKDHKQIMSSIEAIVLSCMNKGNK